VSRSSTRLADLFGSVPSAATVVAVTDDGRDPRYAPVRALAAQAASRVGGSVLFCVAPAHDDAAPRTRPRLFLPPIDGSPTGRPHTGTRGGDLLLDEARAVAAPGLAIGVWLPSRHGPAGVAEAVAATGAAIVLVPERVSRGKVLDRTLEYLAARVPASVVAVGLDGSWRPVARLGGTTAGWPVTSAAPAAGVALRA
jgi:hypothetical protein